MMSLLRKILFIPLSFLYGVGVSIRNWLYDVELINSYTPDIPVISIGNITVGGTGKTPFTEYLIQIMSEYYDVAVLSRGYKRKTKGFVLADENSDFKTIGDEPMQIKMKFPSITVAVCEDRVVGIKKILELHPNTGLILLDDAFQYRKVKPTCNILLMDSNRPIYDDYMLPRGNLRDTPNQIPRAEIVITTKCPDNFTPYDSRVVKKYLNLLPYQNMYFTRIQYSPLIPLFQIEEDGSQRKEFDKDTKIIVMAGIASPGPLLEYVDTKYTLVDSLLFPDHHNFYMKDILKLEEKLENYPEDTIVVVTEKDAVKLCHSRKISDSTMRRIYYLSIDSGFVYGDEDAFKDNLLKILKKNATESKENS